MEITIYIVYFQTIINPLNFDNLQTKKIINFFDVSYTMDSNSTGYFSAAKVQELEVYSLSAQWEIQKKELIYYFEVNMQNH